MASNRAGPISWWYRWWRPRKNPPRVTAVTVQQGVHLTWQARGTDFRVFRKVEAGDFAPVASVKTPEWTDSGTEFGKRYTYLVQSIVSVGNQKQAESDLSDEASIVPRDIFPPVAPKGVQASTAPNSIELNWDRNTEEDLNGYRIYRAEGNGAMEKTGEVSAIPSFSDRKVEHGKTYHYAISAVDHAGNESPRSAPVEVAMP